MLTLASPQIRHLKSTDLGKFLVFIRLIRLIIHTFGDTENNFLLSAGIVVKEKALK